MHTLKSCFKTLISSKMKQSFYNIFIPDKNKVLCFNSFSNSYVIISPQAYMSLQNEGIESLAKSHSKTFEALVNSGFIIDESIDQLDIIRNENKKERLSPGIDYLMVYPTQNCNLKCWYCYETHVLNSKMSEEVLEIQRVILRNYAKIQLTGY